MDLERFKAVASDPKRTLAELAQMKVNALAKNNWEAVEILDQVMAGRPSVKATGKVGRTPTQASFKGEKRDFDSAKEAYLWLVERFRGTSAGLLERYVDDYSRVNRSRGLRFATASEKLFPPGSSRVGNPQFVHNFGDGWFADVNISNDDKYAALLMLSSLSGISEPEWQFQPSIASDALRKHREQVALGNSLLEELRGKKPV
jgi:hypothetical protein